MAGGNARQAGDEREMLAAPAEAAFASPPMPGTALTPPPPDRGVAGPATIFDRTGARLSGWRATEAALGFRASLAVAALTEWERGTGFLFAPVCLCVGALIYFSLTVEPTFGEIASMTAALGVAMLLTRDRIVARHLLAALMLVALGMGAAKFETWRAGTKIIGGEISTRVTGRVVQIEHQASGRVRLTLDVIETARPKLRYSPDRIRVTARSIPETVTVGSGVSGVVRLRQPSGPVRPGSYDFAFNSYFDGIGASGFFLGDPEPAVLEEPPPLGARAAATLERSRVALATRIRDAIGGTEGAIAAALITGVSAAVPEDANEAMRVSGIYHVMSISGLHLALVAGTVMISMRAAFALFPGFASRRPIKKYAAGIALLVVFFYLLLSGAEVATRRSFIMLAVMLLALMFDRAALTMRNLAIAAIIVVGVSPHEVAGPSFQMSFAATAALIAAYAAWLGRRARSPARDARPSGLAGRALRFILLYGGGIAMTSIVAGTATALFGAWHFNRVAPLGLVANLAAMPVVSLLVMPFAVFAMLLMPFGLDQLALGVMGKGIALMLAIAEWVAARSPFDVVGIIPVEAVLFFSAALVLLTVLTTRLRIAAAPLLLAGMAALFARQPPEALIAEDGRLVAVQLADGRLAVNRARPNGFTMENWARAMLASDTVKPEPATGIVEASVSGDATASAQGFSCRDGLCLARHPRGATIAHAADGAIAAAACGVADLIVIDDATAGNVCAGKSTVITKRDLGRRGSAEVRFHQTAAGVSAEATYAIIEPYRPWHGHRAFSREARGMAPYKRPERRANPPAQESSDESAAASPEGDAAHAAAAQ